MEFDQYIFKKFVDIFKKKKDDPVLLSRTVYLHDIKERLSVLSRALTGKPIDIITSEREGGWRNNTFFLPERINIFDSIEKNLKFYLFRIFYLAEQKNMGFNWKESDSFSVKESQRKAHDSSKRVLEELFEEFPLLKPVFEDLENSFPSIEKKGKEILEKDFTWLYGRWMKNYHEKDQDELKNISKKAKEAMAKPTTEIKAKPSDDVESIQVDKKAQEDYMLTHNFEKVETAEEFSGTWRDFDGDDTLQDDVNALDELNLKQTVRVDDPVHSVYQAEFAGNATIGESKEIEDSNFHYTYPEWDFTKRRYKNDYCKVFPKNISKSKPDYYLKTIEQNRSVLLSLKKMFAILNNRLEQIKRQTSGEEFDIDAVTDMYADVHARRTPDDRIYITKRKREKELSMLFLLDLSLSSDGYAGGNRVLDVEKQVSILFGEVLNEYFVDFQIDGFHSKTRNFSTYITLKGFDESWQKAKMKIGTVQPTGYTRIGPALRHAGSILQQRYARKKWLILLSDGKPNDYDKYEGKYGVEDIKQALRELNSEGINTFAFAIEEQARYYLPQMFGQNHYNILTNPVELIQSLVKLYEKIAGS